MGLKNKIAMPYVKEALKSEVDLNPVKFPRELGETHPFEFKVCEDTCTKFGLARTAVDKHLDFIISPDFTIKSKVPEAQKLLTSLIKDTEFVPIVRAWIEEALSKGNGFMEIDVEKDVVNLKVTNANNMYVKRKKNGDLVCYNQYIGKMPFDPDKIITFNPDEMAHLAINKIADSAYGLGIIRPALRTIENIMRANKDQHVLMTRKANNPIIAKVGTDEFPATQDEVTAIGQKLEYLNNMHEWAFDHRVDFKVVDFGNISEKFTSLLESDKQELFMSFQVPAVLMGDSQQNEGIAKVQLDTFERRISSLQQQIETIIENQIFTPYLNKNGIEADVEMVWGLPSEDAINDRIVKLTNLLSNMGISPMLKAMVEKDIAKTLGYDETEIDKLNTPEKAQAEAEKEKKLKQPEIPGIKPNAAERLMIKSSWNKEFIKETDMKIDEFVNIKEIPGFNYSEYITAVLSKVEKDKFVDLRALSEKEISEGLLSEQDIQTLRNVLYDGFKDNKTIGQIVSDLKENIQFKDRLKDGQIVLPAENRPSVVARTETVRLSNEGIVQIYKANDIQQVRWLASISDRTCPDCEAMNGQIYDINELAVGVNQPPLHVNCRCALLSVK